MLDNLVGGMGGWDQLHKMQKELEKERPPPPPPPPPPPFPTGVSSGERGYPGAPGPAGKKSHF